MPRSIAFIDLAQTGHTPTALKRAAFDNQVIFPFSSLMPGTGLWLDDRSSHRHHSLGGSNSAEIAQLAFVANALAGQSDTFITGGRSDHVVAHSVAFIDPRVANYPELAQALDPSVEAVFLNVNEDGVEQIADWLEDHSGIDAVHIVSHGAEASLFLGSSVLSSATLPTYGHLLSRIGSALSNEGDILIYGCDVASGPEGRAFIEQLALLTGADVAASDDRTGASILGGDAELEVTFGDVTTNPFLDKQMLDSSGLILADDFLSTTSTTGAIAVGGSSFGNIEVAGDTDWFRITLTAGKTYRFDLEGSATGQGTLSDPFLRLRDSTGAAVTNAFADDGGTGLNSRFTFAITTTGTYFLAAGSNTPTGIGTYKMSVADVTPPPPSDTIRATTGTIGVLSVNGSVTGTIEAEPMSLDATSTISASDLQGGFIDKDWYQVTLQKGHTYTFQASSTSLTTNMVSATLRDSTGAVVQNIYNNGTNQFAEGGTASFAFDTTNQANTFETYYLAVGAGGSDPAFRTATGSFTASVTDSGAVGADTIPGTISTTATLGLGTIPGTIEQFDVSGGTEDVDYYKVFLVGGHHYTFSANANVSGIDTLDSVRIRLRNQSGVELGPIGSTQDKTAAGPNPTFTFDAPGTGTTLYHLAISASSAGSVSATPSIEKTGSYLITLTDQGGVSPSVDAIADTTAAAAVYLSAGQTTGHIDTLGQDGLAGDNDVYRVSLTAGNSYTFAATAGVSSADTLDDVFIRLYDTTGAPFSSDKVAFGASPTLSFTPPTSGDYFFAISANGQADTWETKTGDYQITLTNNGATGATKRGEALVEEALRHLGEEYFWGVSPGQAAYADPNHAGPWDCSEFVSWLVDKVYDEQIGLRSWNAFTGHWAEDADKAGSPLHYISLADARNTPGAIIFHYDNTLRHIAISEGNGKLIEANVNYRNGNFYSDDGTARPPLANGEPPTGVDIGDVGERAFDLNYYSAANGWKQWCSTTWFIRPRRS